MGKTQYYIEDKKFWYTALGSIGGTFSWTLYFLDRCCWSRGGPWWSPYALHYYISLLTATIMRFLLHNCLFSFLSSLEICVLGMVIFKQMTRSIISCPTNPPKFVHQWMTFLIVLYWPGSFDVISFFFFKH